MGGVMPAHRHAAGFPKGIHRSGCGSRWRSGPSPQLPATLVTVAPPVCCSVCRTLSRRASRRYRIGGVPMKLRKCSKIVRWATPEAATMSRSAIAAARFSSMYSMARSTSRGAIGLSRCGRPTASCRRHRSSPTSNSCSALPVAAAALPRADAVRRRATAARNAARIGIDRSPDRSTRVPWCLAGSARQNRAGFGHPRRNLQSLQTRLAGRGRRHMNG
jgi:hypothetical protein